MGYDTVNTELTFGPFSVGIVQDQASNGRPELRIWLTGDPNYNTGTIPSFTGGAGTLGAPILGFPSPIASTPTSMTVSMPVDAAAGDVFKMAMSASSAMTNFTLLTHTITPAEVLAGSFTAGIATPPFPITYFQALISRAGVDSANLSNKVAWGSAVAPVITTATVNSIPETVPLSVALTATTSVGVLAWSLSGGVDVLQEQISGSTLQWAGNGVQQYGNPQDSDFNNSYLSQVTCQDFCGNTAVLSETINVLLADTTPNAFTLGTQNNATGGQTYQSSIIQILGIDAPPISAPATLTAGQYRIDTTGTGSNFGSWINAGNFFVPLNSLVQVQGTALTTPGSNALFTLNIGGASGITSSTFTIITSGASNQLDPTVNNITSGGTYTFSNSNMTIFNTNGTANKLAISLSTFSVGSGLKLYFEAHADVASSGCNIGICDGSFDNFPGGVGAHTAVYNALGTQWYNNVQVSASFASWTTGDTVGIAIDVDNKKVWFCKIVAGVQQWQGAGNNPNTNSGGLLMNAAGTGNTLHFSIGANALNNQMTIHIDAASMLCAPPTSFTTLL